MACARMEGATLVIPSFHGFAYNEWHLLWQFGHVHHPEPFRIKNPTRMNTQVQPAPRVAALAGIAVYAYLVTTKEVSRIEGRNTLCGLGNRL